MRRSLLLIPILAAGCTRRPEAPAQAVGPPVPVAVATVRQAEAPVVIRTIGSVESPASVIIKPQVSAQLKELSVAEGSDVTAGQVLMLLDSRPFDLELRRAQATLARDRAVADDAKRMVERYSTLRQSDVSSSRELEAAQTTAASADAQLLADQASIDAARLNLDYCTIKAPFPGRLGQFLVKPGAIVKSEETELADLTQIAPVDVSFSIIESRLDAVRAAFARGPLAVQVTTDQGAAPVQGTLTFIDNRVDPTTGAIRLKASFTNESRLLWPGRFVSVALEVSRDAGAILVPDTAVQPSQSGPSVYIVKADETVELRPVTVRRSADGDTVIDQGVAAGETVVTDGQLRLAPGVKVRVKQEPGAAAKSP